MPDVELERLLRSMEYGKNAPELLLPDIVEHARNYRSQVIGEFFSRVWLWLKHRSRPRKRIPIETNPSPTT